MRDEVLGVGALQHHDPGVLAGFQLADQLTRSRTSSGPIRFIGGASITTPTTPLPLGATRSVRYT